MKLNTSEPGDEQPYDKPLARIVWDSYDAGRNDASFGYPSFKKEIDGLFQAHLGRYKAELVKAVTLGLTIETTNSMYVTGFNDCIDQVKDIIQKGV